MGTVARWVLARRPVDEVAKVALDPDTVLPLIGVIGRFKPVATRPDGSREWDIYLKVGSIDVGGRVLVEPATESSLAWRSEQGTHHSAVIDVAPADGGTRITMSVSAEFAGRLTGPLTGVLAGGIMGRQIEAALQQLRHYLEYES